MDDDTTRTQLSVLSCTQQVVIMAVREGGPLPGNTCASNSNTLMPHLPVEIGEVNRFWVGGVGLTGETRPAPLSHTPSGRYPAPVRTIPA